jgi:cytochrome c-type biogenesis protein CcmE
MTLIVAMHDEEYMPPEAAEALARAHQQGDAGLGGAR